MTIYQEFLGFALDEHDRRHPGLGGSDLEVVLLNEVATRRHALSGLARERDASGAIAANANYDAALVLLARSRGIECDLATFARPETARAELEASLCTNPAEFAQTDAALTDDPGSLRTRRGFARSGR